LERAGSTGQDSQGLRRIGPFWQLPGARAVCVLRRRTFPGRSSLRVALPQTLPHPVQTAVGPGVRSRPGRRRHGLLAATRF